MQEKKKNPKNPKTKKQAPPGRGSGRGRGSEADLSALLGKLTPAQADLVGKISELTKGPTRRTKGTYAGPAAARAEKPVKDEI